MDVSSFLFIRVRECSHTLLNKHTVHARVSITVPDQKLSTAELLNVVICTIVNVCAYLLLVQCSAACGEGTQRLLVVCRRMGLNGQYQTLIPEACSSIPKPSTARSCSSGPCESKITLVQCQLLFSDCKIQHTLKHSNATVMNLQRV